MAPPGSAAPDRDSDAALSDRKPKRGRGPRSSTHRGTPLGDRRRASPVRKESTFQPDGTYLSQPPTPLQGFTPMQHAQPSPSAPPGKVPIARLNQPQSHQMGAKSKGRERTSHACDKCRKAKAKCSGGQPCDKCKAENRECYYGDGKRDKDRK